MNIENKIYSFFKKIDNFLSFFIKAPLFLFLFLFFSAVGFYFFQYESLELFLANKGSSPLHWLYVSENPVKNVIDWPTGTRNLGKSFTVNIYNFMHVYSDVDLLSVINIYIAVEVIAILGSFLYFYRASSNNNKLYCSVFFTFIVGLTAFQFMNLARFGYPFSWGLYYSLAAAFRILGIAFIIKDKPWSAVTMLAISIVIHPIMGGVAALAGAMVILYRGLTNVQKYIFPTCVLALPTLSWLFFSYINENISGGEIPVENWLFLSKLFNSHWYPFSIGTFDILASKHWLPTISILMIYVMFSLTERGKGLVKTEIHILVGALTVITGLGLIISFLEVAPFLIKLSLHRASDLLIVVAFVPILTKLLDDLSKDNILFRMLAVGLLVSPFLYYKDPGFPLSIALLYSVQFIVDVFKNDKLSLKILVFVIWCMAALVLFHHVMYVSGYLPFFRIFKAVGFFDFKDVGFFDFIISFVFFLVLFFVFVFNKFKSIVFMLMLFFMTLSIPKLNYDRTQRLFSGSPIAFYETQLWARNNTPEDSLFMISPGGGGAWRDVSRRASFGTVREWLHNAWLYDSDFKLYEEGVRRSELFGVNLKELMKNSIDGGRERIGLSRILTAKAHSIYYNSDKEFYNYFSSEEGVDYFVFENKRISTYPDGLVQVYRNDYFTVFSPLKHSPDD